MFIYKIRHVSYPLSTVSFVSFCFSDPYPRALKPPLVKYPKTPYNTPNGLALNLSGLPNRPRIQAYSAVVNFGTMNAQHQ